MSQMFNTAPEADTNIAGPTVSLAMSSRSTPSTAKLRRRALAHFRQLCSLGLSPAQIVPDLMRTLHEVIPAHQNMIIWTAADGRPVSRFCQYFEPRARVAYDSGRLDGQPDLADLAVRGRRTGNLRSMPASFYNSAYFSLVRRPHQAWHSLDGVARRQGKPLAVVVMHRERGHEFDDDEELLLASLLPHVDHALSVPASASIAHDDAASTQELVLICDADGKLQFWTPAAAQWLDQLYASGGEARRQLPAPLRALCQRLRAVSAGVPADPPACRIDGPWGSVLARASPLDGNASDGAGAVVIRMQLQVPPSLQLARALASHSLSPRRGEVALQLATGVAPAQIARKLGISPNTCKEYVADVYAALGVSRQAELVSRLLGDARR